MIKDLLMFMPGSINHGSLNCFLDIYARWLENRGINVHRISLSDAQEEIGRKLSGLLVSEHIDVAISLNASGLQDIKNGDDNLWDSLGIPMINYIVDHPLEHSGGLESTCKNYHVICLDKYHAEFIRKFYGSIKSVHVLPLTGVGKINTPVEDYDTFCARKHNLMVTMGLFDINKLIDQMKQLPEEVRQIAYDWTDYMEEHIDLSPEIALREMLDHKFGKGNIGDELYFAFSGLGAITVPYIRVLLRIRIVKKLMESGLDFTICGAGWEDINAEITSSHAILRGDVPMIETPELYRNTKLAINVLPMFKGGTHDRIATAQINGAAVITDGNDFLRSLYKPDEIEFFDLSEADTLADRIRQIMADPHRLYETAIKGQAVAREKLSGEPASEKLLNILESVKE